MANEKFGGPGSFARTYKKIGSWIDYPEPMVILPKRTTGIRVGHYFITVIVRRQ
jgi:hypothetical protein